MGLRWIAVLAVGLSCAPRFYAGSGTSTAQCPGFTQPSADFTVNSSGDASDAGINGVCDVGGGVCTLRAAVEEANSAAGTQKILIPAGLTVNVASEIGISSPVQIFGGNRLTSIIHGGGVTRVFSTLGTPNTDVELDNLTLQNANVAGDGAGLATYGGNIALRYTVFSFNAATGGGYGGAVSIDNFFGTLDGSLTVDCSLFDTNQAGGEGGGLYAGARTVAITNSEFDSNTAGTNGGGIGLSQGATVVSHSIARVLLTRNEAGGGVGGAIAVASGGPAIPVRIESSTIQLNRASGGAAGLYTDNAVTVDLYNNTLADNVGLGGFADLFQINTGGTVNAANNIFWNNTGPANTCSIAGTWTSLGHNIYDTMSNCPMAGSDTTSSPGLGSLADNGGFAFSMSITAGGPADGGGDSAYCPTTDQRNVTRGTPCDVGAFESR